MIVVTSLTTQSIHRRWLISDGIDYYYYNLFLETLNSFFFGPPRATSYFLARLAGGGLVSSLRRRRCSCRSKKFCPRRRSVQSLVTSSANSNNPRRCMDSVCGACQKKNFHRHSTLGGTHKSTTRQSKNT